MALGGGVTGDMAGFAAACYLRGVSFVQVPTSLLAQVDSSVGGKTAVDLPQGKNLAGAFHQPALVLIDPDTLGTLPPLFFSDGMGEVIKYGCIRSRALFDTLRDAADLTPQMESILFSCVDCKREFVEHDEFDTGERMVLNFGHTLGHALEKAHSYTGLTHGAAVGIGMVLMAHLGEHMGLTEAGTTEQIASLLENTACPSQTAHRLTKSWKPPRWIKRGWAVICGSFFCARSETASFTACRARELPACAAKPSRSGKDGESNGRGSRDASARPSERLCGRAALKKCRAPGHSLRRPRSALVTGETESILSLSPCPTISGQRCAPRTHSACGLSLKTACVPSPPGRARREPSRSTAGKADLHSAS